MRSITLRLAASASALSLVFFVACVSDTGISSSGGTADAATPDAGSTEDAGGGGDAGPGPTEDGGSDAQPAATTCSNDQTFDKEDPIQGTAGATWFSIMPLEKRAYYVAGGKLFSADLSPSGVANPVQLSGKADAVSGAIDAQNKPLLAFRGSSIDVNTFIGWDDNGAVSAGGVQIAKFIHANLLHDGSRMIARFDSSNGAGGDNKIYEFTLTPDYARKTVAYAQQNLVVNEAALYPVYGVDGLSIIYVSSATGLTFATRTNVGLAFDTPQAVKHALNLLADAHPHSLSRDKCRLYFTRPGAGAFVATRKPNLP